MSWFSDIASKTESFLNKIDQKTANVLNTSTDLISTVVDDNRFVASNNLANSQSLPQLKIFVNNDQETEFKQTHSREPSTASYHGLTMKDTSTLRNKFLNNQTRAIDDGQLFNYLNNKDSNLSGYLTVEDNHNYEQVKNESLNLDNYKNYDNFNSESFGSTNQFNNQNSSTINHFDSSTNQDSKKDQKDALKNLLKDEKQKLNELKNEYRKHTDTLNNEINFLKDKLDQYANQKNLQNEITSLKEQLKSEKLNKEKFENEITILSSSFSRLKNEFEEYKVRAQRTLQSKDNLIEKLEHNSNLNENKSESDSKMQSELDKLENDNNQLKQELEDLKGKLFKLTQEADNCENERINELDNQLKQSKFELNALRTINQQLEEDIKNLQKESNQKLQDELNKLNQAHQIELESKQKQINELTNESVNLKENKWSQCLVPQDLELKIKNLTENLLNKQTLVEHLKREKNSLVLQLEENKRQLSNLQNKNSNYYINFKDGLDHQTNSQIDSSFSNLNDSGSSFKTPVARHVRKAYSQLDQLRYVESLLLI